MSVQVEPPKRRAPVASRPSVTRRRGASTKPGGRAAARAIAHRGRHTSPRGDGFGKFTGVTLLSVFPGLGLVAAGRRRIGAVIVLVTTLTLITLAVIALGGDAVGHTIDIATNPTKLAFIIILLILVAAGWCMTVVAASWSAKPVMPTPIQRIMGSGLVCITCLAVAAPGMVGAKYAFITRKTISSVGSDSAARVDGAALPDSKKKDPWAKQPRVNLLLLGSDAGESRVGIRTDSMMVASIDTKNGKTTLIGLPRSLQNAPFPADSPLAEVWPDGFDCGSECLLNAVWRQADSDRRDLFPGVKNPGLITLRGVITEITGLRIDAYTIINLNGFKSLVNAMGGVTVNVTQRLPIGTDPITGWIEPGRRKLDGNDALWFSRSRESTDDYDRMRRQRCMV
ncbi:MAG: LCP family protein, partial [Angustibacter sp.]